MNTDAKSALTLKEINKRLESANIDDYIFYGLLTNNHYLAILLLRHIIALSSSKQGLSNFGWVWISDDSRKHLGCSKYQLKEAIKRIEPWIETTRRNQYGKKVTLYRPNESAILQKIDSFIFQPRTTSENNGF